MSERDMFSELCKNFRDETVGDIKKFNFDNELVEYVGGDIKPYDFTIQHNGIEYYTHWLFFNIKHNSSVYGVLYLPYNHDGDVIFGVVGNKLETINNGIMPSFNEVYDILMDSKYFID